MFKHLGALSKSETFQNLFFFAISLKLVYFLKNNRVMFPLLSKTYFYLLDILLDTLLDIFY